MNVKYHKASSIYSRTYSRLKVEKIGCRMLLLYFSY